MKPSEFQSRMADAAVVNYKNGLGCDSARYEKVRRIFERLPYGRVLDVGCADGSILGPLTGHHEIHGLDICPELVREACARGLRARMWNLDESPLPYHNLVFNHVHCGETIEHVADTDFLLCEINRVLAPGGHLILTFPNIRTPVGVAMLLFADLPPMFAARYRSGHFRDFTLRTMRIALRNAGFKIERALGAFFWLPFFGECFTTLASLVPSWSASIIVVARKTREAAYDPEEAAGDPGYRKGMWR